MAPLVDSVVGRSLLVISIAVLPALADETRSVMLAPAQHAASDEPLRLMHLLAANLGTMVLQAREALAAAHRLETGGGSGGGCDAVLAELRVRSNVYVSVIAAGPGGRIDCAARATAAGREENPAEVTLGTWFTGALETGFAATIDPLILTLAEPCRDPAGRITGVIAVGLSQAWLNQLLKAALPLTGATARLVAADGRVLAGSDDRALWRDHRSMGATTAETDGVSDMTRPAAGDGFYRIVGIAPIGPPEWGLAVTVGVDQVATTATGIGPDLRHILLLLGGFTAALGLACRGPWRLRRPAIGAPPPAGIGWSPGTLSTRTLSCRGSRKFHSLAATFDRVAAALRLRERMRERTLRNALESTTDGVVLLDRGWRFTFLNAHAVSLLGTGRNLLGQRLWDCFPGAAGTSLWPALHEARAHCTPRQVEIFESTLCRQLDIQAYPSPEGLTVFIRDVTDQRRADTRAAEQDALLRVVAEAIPSLVHIADRLGRIIYVNRRYQEFSGLPADLLLGDGWRCLLHPDEVSRVAAYWADGVAQEMPQEVELRLRSDDGCWHWFLSRAAPLRDAEGHIEYWYGISTGIDEIVAARAAQARQGEVLERLVTERTAELRVREAQLAQAQKMEAVGQLTGGVAHDFNNLLQAVSGNLELALAALGRDDSARVRRLLANAARAISRGARLTAQLLAFSRRQILRAERVEARRLIDDMADLLRRAAGETVTVETRAEPGLWPCLADPAQLEAAILNLVINARDAMPEGGRLAIALGNAPLDQVAAASLELAPGDYVRLDVRDTGAGMTPAVLARAFEPFFTTKEIGRGSGLGLAQVHGFASQSGGAVRIASQPGAGTTITLYFPRDTAPAERPVPAGPPPTSRGRNAQVLLVEDDAEVLDTLQFALIDAGFQVVPARDGADALSVLHSEKGLDLVLSDVVLPGGISGVDVGRMAHRLRPGLPVLLTSGHTGEALALHTAAAGFELIAKPYPQSELLARVATLIDGSREPA